jgi:23S rRNA (guanosine2251-2'-O)-methyltransferase
MRWADRKKPVADNFVYGFHAVEAILRYSPHRAKKLLIARKLDLDELLALAAKANVSVEYIDRAHLENRFALGSESQGLVMLVAPFVYAPLDEILPNASCLLILDTWQDPANLGRAARAALCFGADALVICSDRSAEINSAAEKSAVGALARMPVAKVGNLATAMKKIKEYNFFIYGADERGEIALADCDFAAKKALVIGQEGSGLRELTKKNCDILVNIPMAQKDICLNAADTALVFLYELYRRNK